MPDRIIEIASPARLSIRDSRLVISRQGQPDAGAPVADLAALVLAHPAVVLSQAVAARLAAAGALTVFCDTAFRPAAVALPLDSHCVQTERIAAQSGLAPGRRGRLWQQVVRAKITAQAALLAELRGGDGGLAALAPRVAPGDSGNLEARAAQRYWRRLFAQPRFRRHAPVWPQNRHLDYGYMALRAATARAVCAAGLHPSLGLRHHNRYDPFSLAADLMEPFRPIVDRQVVLRLQSHPPDEEFSRELRAWLLAPLAARYAHGGEIRSLFDWLARAAQSLAAAIAGRSKTLSLPVPLSPCPAPASLPPTAPCG